MHPQNLGFTLVAESNTNTTEESYRQVEMAQTTQIFRIIHIQNAREIRVSHIVGALSIKTGGVSTKSQHKKLNVKEL